MRIPQVVDCIAQCATHDTTFRPLAEDRRSRLVIHRTGLGEHAEEICAAYAHDPAAAAVTGGQMPYTFIVTRSGIIEQALRVTDIGPHARAWSSTGIGVGIVGDFRSEPPTPEQWQALRVLAHVFSGWLGGPNAIVGHDELPNYSHDLTKRCPGELLEMTRLRWEVYAADRARVACLGVVF